MKVSKSLRIAIWIFTGVAVAVTWSYEVRAQNWELVWQDEFDADTLDTSKWSYQYGTGASEGLIGWGNNELQYYTDRPENIFVADGKLHIVARQEVFQNRNYTSARIRSIHQGDWKYGRFEIRAKLPEGQGLWPAIWMMPTHNVYGGWAASGEIDIMELVGHEPDVVHGTLHFGGSWPHNVHQGASFQLPEGKFSDDYHVFALEWRENSMRWFVNGTLYQLQSNWYTQGHDFPAPFDQEFHFILNVAVGGNWPGSPNHTTVFPQTMSIDYVRVYQDATQTSSDGGFSSNSDSVILKANYPNPFDDRTVIKFVLPEPSEVSLDIYDVLGRHVKTVTRGHHSAGDHSVTVHSEGLVSGVYLYRLQAGPHVQSRTMMVAR